MANRTNNCNQYLEEQYKRSSLKDFAGGDYLSDKANVNMVKQGAKVLKRRGGGPAQRKSDTILDARQKIIQKKRKNVVDARDILAKMAKKQDARSKIMKIREQRKGENVVNGNVQAIGSSILRKTDRNGKISLVTNKSKQNPRDLNMAVRQQLGLVPPVRHQSPMIKKMIVKPASLAPKPSLRNFTPPIIRKTILNDVEYTPAPMPRPPNYLYESDNMHWYKSSLNLNPSLIGSVRHMPEGDWRQGTYAPSAVKLARKPAAYIDLDAVDDEDMPLAPLKTSRISNVHSRLDNMPMQAQSHGILSPPKTKVVVPAGHRIVVSNLHSSVSQTDIRELFEDIGELLVARLVRPGTAEVIYKNLKDAQKAVDTYHNRQLDGQPMKCLLVNKRPLNNPTAPAINSSSATSKSTNEGFLNVRKSSSSSSSRLVPDLSTIHKVLFQRN